MKAGRRPKGIYVSYDEKKHGPFEEAVRTSNEGGYLVWLDKNPLDPETKSLEFPAIIVIRTKKVGRYYRGTLIAIHRRKEVNCKKLLSETTIAQRDGNKWIGNANTPIFRVFCTLKD